MKIWSIGSTAALVLAISAALGPVTIATAQSPEGLKARISVGTIDSKTGDCSRTKAESLRAMFIDALGASGGFIVVDQTASSDLAISGAIKDFEPEVKAGGGFGALKKKAFEAAGAAAKTARIKWELELRDVARDRTLKKLKVEGKSTDWSVDAARSAFSAQIGMVGELAAYEGEPMADAIREMLARTVDETRERAPDDYFKYAGEQQMVAGAAADAAVGGGGGAGGNAEPPTAADDMKLYTRYDFVPGDRVIFYDDMKGEEEGEFPFRWNLDTGVFEVVRLGRDFWIMATDDGSVTPKTPRGPLPPKYTVELEFYDNGPQVGGNYFYIRWVDAQDQNIGEFGICAGNDTWLHLRGKTQASKRLPERLGKGVHTLRIMATSRSIKCYVDQVRVGNVPKIEGFDPVGFRLRFRPYNDPDNPTLFRGFRLAEGGKSLREQLDESGKIVTHGILFDSGSAQIKGESYRTLKNIGQLLTDDPGLRLSIEGHTDSDGADASNKTLSEQRAASVRSYLIGEYGIAGERLEAKGWGEAQALDTNATAEGKANNRRVELVRI